MSKPVIDVEECARTLVSRLAARQDAARARARALIGQAELAARTLREELGARRVWLFGSLAWGEPHEGSDVDLFVEGLDAARRSEAERRLECLIEGPFDLVREEDAPPGLAERVHREGRELP